MAVVDSSNTAQEIADAVVDNLSYAEDGSVSKCRSFITAVQAWIFTRPKRAADGAAETSIDLPIEEARRLLDDARSWLASNGEASDGAAGIKHLGFEDFRT